MSVELVLNERGRPACVHGVIAHTVVSSDHPGEIRGVGPIIVVNADDKRETANLGHFGVDYWVEGDYAHIKAANGQWVWKLEPAHWGSPPDDDWCDAVLLGRWPD